MTEKKEEKILYIATCAGDDPEKAALPFVLANAALAMDIKATVVLQGNGVYLARKGYVETMPPAGSFPPVKELLASFLELGGELKFCLPCIKERNIDESQLVLGSKITAAGALNLEAMESDAVFVY